MRGCNDQVSLIYEKNDRELLDIDLKRGFCIIFLVFVKAELLCLLFRCTWFIIAAIRLLSLPLLLAASQN